MGNKRVRVTARFYFTTPLKLVEPLRLDAVAHLRRDVERVNRLVIAGVHLFASIIRRNVRRKILAKSSLRFFIMRRAPGQPVVGAVATHLYREGPFAMRFNALSFETYLRLRVVLLRERLQVHGHDYADFPAHNGLWEMCEKTAHDGLARMALVPRTLEARGLDATPLIQDKLRKANTADTLQAVALLDIILRDEVGHVAIGNHWYHWLCVQRGLDPVTLYGELVRRYEAPRLKPPFNIAARKKAGFTDTELDYLLGA